MEIGLSVSKIAAKLIGKDSDHISRFHSRRGDLCRPIHLMKLPVLAWSRVTGKAKSSPWMAEGAVRRLDRLLTPGDVVLELGSGASTSWYARRVRRVVSLEPDLSWAKRVTSNLSDYPNAEVRVGTVGQLFLSAFREVRPTVLIVDHSDAPEFSRTDAVRLVASEEFLPRLIVLDDSDREGYRPAVGVLENWSMNRYTGFRHNPLRLTETTVFIKN